MSEFYIEGYIVPGEDKWIYEWLGLPATSPRDVHGFLSAQGGMPVTIKVNSYGGDVWSGSDIYASLIDYPGHVTIKVTGLAASAASVVAMGGDTVLMAPTAQMMVHLAATYAEGNRHEMDDASDMLEVTDRSIAAAYVRKSGMSEADALALMDMETWLTAQDAIDFKLADGLMEPEASKKQPVLSNSLPFDRKAIARLKEYIPKMENKAAGSDEAEKKRALALIRLERERYQ